MAFDNEFKKYCKLSELYSMFSDTYSPPPNSKKYLSLNNLSNYNLLYINPYYNVYEDNENYINDPYASSRLLGPYNFYNTSSSKQLANKNFIIATRLSSIQWSSSSSDPLKIAVHFESAQSSGTMMDYQGPYFSFSPKTPIWSPASFYYQSTDDKQLIIAKLSFTFGFTYISETIESRFNSLNSSSTSYSYSYSYSSPSFTWSTSSNRMTWNLDMDKVEDYIYSNNGEKYLAIDGNCGLLRNVIGYMLIHIGLNKPTSYFTVYEEFRDYYSGYMGWDQSGNRNVISLYNNQNNGTLMASCYLYSFDVDFSSYDHLSVPILNYEYPKLFNRTVNSIYISHYNSTNSKTTPNYYVINSNQVSGSSSTNQYVTDIHINNLYYSSDAFPENKTYILSNYYPNVTENTFTNVVETNNLCCFEGLVS